MRQEQRRRERPVGVRQRDQHEAAARPDVQRVRARARSRRRRRRERQLLVAVVEQLFARRRWRRSPRARGAPRSRRRRPRARCRPRAVAALHRAIRSAACRRPRRRRIARRSGIRRRGAARRARRAACSAPRATRSRSLRSARWPYGKKRCCPARSCTMRPRIGIRSFATSASMPARRSAAMPRAASARLIERPPCGAGSRSDALRSMTTGLRPAAREQDREQAARGAAADDGDALARRRAHASSVRRSACTAP